MIGESVHAIRTDAVDVDSAYNPRTSDVNEHTFKMLNTISSIYADLRMKFFPCMAAIPMSIHRHWGHHAVAWRRWASSLEFV
jgi:hypothetical protein